MSRTITTLFDGFGGVNIGAQAAGLTTVTGIEIDPAIAKVASDNLDHKIIVDNILNIDPRSLEPTWALHASPPCPNFSQARAGGRESPTDISLANKISEFIVVMQPEVFTLENVYMYRKSISWEIIRNTLHREGYFIDLAHINAADFGVPQTRKRMIVRAWKKGFLPPLPPPEEWVGWYGAIEDLIPDLPESQFAPWQMARMPESLQDFLVGVQGEHSSHINPNSPAPTITANHTAGKYRAFLMNSTDARETARHKPLAPNSPAPTVRPTVLYKAFLMPGDGNTNYKEAKPGKGMRAIDQPSHNISTLEKGGVVPRAFIVNSQNANSGRGLTIRADHEPMTTITASATKGQSRAWLSEGRVVSMSPRALARFQSIPDSFDLPDKKTLACKGIGNAVPPLLYEKIIGTML